MKSGETLDIGVSEGALDTWQGQINKNREPWKGSVKEIIL